MQREPSTPEEALADVEWKQAMDREYESLTQNGTWDLVPLPQGKKMIDGKWVFKLKTGADGTEFRKKARYVAKGFSQQKGIDYQETFSPVISMPSLRVMLSLAAYKDFELVQIDVDTAYLYGELKEEVYLKQPKGYERHDDDGTPLACLLHKSIYGLKQAGRRWWQHLHAQLTKIGFESTTSEPCLYLRKESNSACFIAVYVDDIIVAAPTPKIIEDIGSALSIQYSIKPAQELNYILGIRISRNREQRTIRLDQETYANQVLERFKMADSKAVKTPAEPRTIADMDDGTEVNYPYREAVGALMYLTTSTRPDLAFAVGRLARRSHQPSSSDVNAVKRTLRYLSGTRDLFITLGGRNTLLVGYADSDYATDVSTRRSVSGSYITIGGGPVAWASRIQPCVTLSTVEAEYVSLSSTAQDMVWLRTLLRDLGFPQTLPSTIFEDNQGAIALAEGVKFSRKSKHIDVRFHFIRQQIEVGNIQLKYCPSQEMLADIFTKALPSSTFTLLRNQICGPRSGGSVRGVPDDRVPDHSDSSHCDV